MPRTRAPKRTALPTEPTREALAEAQRWADKSMLPQTVFATTWSEMPFTNAAAHALPDPTRLDVHDYLDNHYETAPLVTVLPRHYLPRHISS